MVLPDGIIFLSLFSVLTAAAVGGGVPDPAVPPCRPSLRQAEIHWRGESAYGVFLVVPAIDSRVAEAASPRSQLGQAREPGQP